MWGKNKKKTKKHNTNKHNVTLKFNNSSMSRFPLTLASESSKRKHKWPQITNMQPHKRKIQTEMLCVSIPNPALKPSPWELHLTQIYLLPATIKSSNTGKWMWLDKYIRSSRDLVNGCFSLLTLDYFKSIPAEAKRTARTPDMHINNNKKLSKIK